MQDDIIRNSDDLRKALDEAGHEHVPIAELSKVNFPPYLSEEEKLRIQMDCKRKK